MQTFVCQKKKYFFLFLFNVFIFFVFVTPSAFANTANISLSPTTGSFGKPFTVSVIVNGGGDKFNAAQATVTIPDSIFIQNLITGDCNFSFLQTPTVSNASFSGVLLGSSLQKCTVYTMTLA